jgi:glycosyltransferase involved in cell wall biosynthesis
MKVLQLAKFFPPVPGGMESVVFELADGLHARGVDLRVLCAQMPGPRSDTALYSGKYPVTRVHSFGKLLSTSMAPAMLGALKRAAAVDVIHIHLPDPLTTLALWAAKPRARVVLHWHSDIVAQQRALRLYAPLQRWLLERADAILATSRPYADSSPWLANFLHKTTVVPLGIRAPCAADQRAVDEVRQGFGGRRIVFSLGRMTYYKGFDVLIEAARSLPSDCVVAIGGQGELLEKHQALAKRLGVTDKVHFVGRIPDSQLSAWFAAADVFCLPSVARSEAFGVVLLEAMACATPIVTTAIEGSGVPWVNQHGRTGFNVPPRDATTLAGAITTLLQDETLRQAFAANALLRFRNEFTADRMVDATLDLYRRLLA